MNILYLTNHLNIGGITSYLFTLASGMKERGHSVYVASSTGALVWRFTEAGINFIPIPISKQEVSPGVLLSFWKLSRFIKERSIEVIHANSRTTQVLGCLLAKSAEKPYVSTCHGFFKKRIFRKIFPCWGKQVIAVSESVKKHLIKDFGVSEERISVIHNGVDISKYYREQRTEYPSTSPFGKLRTSLGAGRVQKKKQLGLGEGPVVGVISRLSEEKGHTYLIEAMRQVLKNFPAAQLLIVGDGKMKEKLQALVRTLQLHEKTIFLPGVYDTSEVLPLMDVFVLPSVKEGLGLSLMEAMASSVAVIGSDVGGIGSLIEHEKTGLLVKPADSKALKDAIEALLQNAQKRQALAISGRLSVEKNFSKEKMVEETEKVYARCCEMLV